MKEFVRVTGQREFCVGISACQLESAILVREIWFDVRGQPAQRNSRDRWNRGMLGSGRAAPKEGHMSLEVSAFHNVMQLL
jgi:hypothetical protein